MGPSFLYYSKVVLVGEWASDEVVKIKDFMAQAVATAAEEVVMVKNTVASVITDVDGVDLS